MMILLTAPQSDMVFTIDHATIAVAVRDKGNPLITLVVTKLISPQGNLLYHTKESPEEVAALVNAAVKGELVQSGGPKRSLITEH